MTCQWLLDKICRVKEKLPLIEFHGNVYAYIYECTLPDGRKICLRVDPEIPSEDYPEYIYEVPCD